MTHVAGRNSREIQEAHFMSNNLFSGSHAFFDITWENVV